MYSPSNKPKPTPKLLNEIGTLHRQAKSLAKSCKQGEIEVEAILDALNATLRELHPSVPGIDPLIIQMAAVRPFEIKEANSMSFIDSDEAPPPSIVDYRNNMTNLLMHDVEFGLVFLFHREQVTSSRCAPIASFWAPKLKQAHKTCTVEE